MRGADGALLVRVHAQPGARKTELMGLHGAALKIRVCAPPVEGRANEALAEFLAERFSVSRLDVRLVSGEKSREKRFEIRGSRLDPADLL